MYSYRYYTTDSWIEISSQPSSSSLSSVADNNEIVTTGLRVQQHQHEQHRATSSASPNTLRRHRRLSRAEAVNLHIAEQRRQSGLTKVDTSSQDEYEESESESDRLLSSSTEEVAALGSGYRAAQMLPLPPASASFSSDGAESDNEDDNLTALGVRGHAAGVSSQFRPQPNAFSHPPAPPMNRSYTNPPAERSVSSGGSGTARPTASHSQRNSYSSARRNSMRSSSRPQHSPYNMISPSYQADHDAALRASLSTLLSCAAAARGSSKYRDSGSKSQSPPRNGANVIEPGNLRLVPESVAMGGQQTSAPEPTFVPTIPQSSVKAEPTSSTASSPQNVTRPSSTPSRPSSPSYASKSKRKSTPAQSHAQHTKRSRRTLAIEESVSPTLMTWVLSAGVVVLFSAISFTAGYALGREVGRSEVGLEFGGAGFRGVGGNESAMVLMDGVEGKSLGGLGLRRLRWGGGVGSVSVGA